MTTGNERIFTNDDIESIIKTAQKLSENAERLLNYFNACLERAKYEFLYQFETMLCSLQGIFSRSFEYDVYWTGAKADITVEDRSYICNIDDSSRTWGDIIWNINRDILYKVSTDREAFDLQESIKNRLAPKYLEPFECIDKIGLSIDISSGWNYDGASKCGRKLHYIIGSKKCGQTAGDILIGENKAIEYRDLILEVVDKYLASHKKEDWTDGNWWDRPESDVDNKEEGCEFNF